MVCGGILHASAGCADQHPASTEVRSYDLTITTVQQHLSRGGKRETYKAQDTAGIGCMGKGEAEVYRAFT